MPVPVVLLTRRAVRAAFVPVPVVLLTRGAVGAAFVPLIVHCVGVDIVACGSPCDDGFLLAMVGVTGGFESILYTHAVVVGLLFDWLTHASQKKATE